MDEERQQLLRQLPDVDHLLQRPVLLTWQERKSRQAVRDAVRNVLDERRQAILAGQWDQPFSGDDFDRAVVSRLQAEETGHLRRVINATGTVLHTNLGRAVFSPDLARHIANLVCHYSNLEYDLASGKRGSRYDHVRELLCELTGAEDAIVVNNNAAAVLLTLSSMAAGRSRRVAGNSSKSAAPSGFPTSSNRAAAVSAKSVRPTRLICPTTNGPSAKIRRPS